MRPESAGERLHVRVTRQNQRPPIRSPSQRLAKKLRDSAKASSVAATVNGGMRGDRSGDANARRPVPETTSAEQRMPRDFRPQAHSPNASTAKKVDKNIAIGSSPCRSNNTSKNAPHHHGTTCRITSKATANHHGTSNTCTNYVHPTNEALVSEVKSEGKKWVSPTRPVPSAPPLSTCSLPEQPTNNPSLPNSSTQSRPGAYRVQGRGGRGQRIHSTNQQHGAFINDEIAVPTAFLVEEDDGKIIEAQPMTSNKTKCLLGFGILSIAVGIVLGIMFGVGLLPPEDPVPDPSHTKESLLALIVSESQDKGAAVMSKYSPQASAFEWLCGDPNLSNYSDGRILERYALATLYESTNGDEWKNNSGWLSYETSECDWAHISCNVDSFSVETLIADKNRLDGTLPSEIFHHLKQLFELDLSDNNLSGTLGNDLGTSLGWFRLHDTNIQGHLLYSAFYRLSKLRSIHLYRSSISGSIPDSIYNLGSLQVLRLSSNMMTGTIGTAIGNLLNVESLWLSGNSFTSTLPTELGNLHRLDTLYIHKNKFVGEIPSELGRLTKLEEATFHGNEFTGSMPDEVCALVDRSLFFLHADCREGSKQYLQCDCCTGCCRDGKKCIEPL